MSSKTTASLTKILIEEIRILRDELLEAKWENEKQGALIDENREYVLSYRRQYEEACRKLAFYTRKDWVSRVRDFLRLNKTCSHGWITVELGVVNTLSYEKITMCSNCHAKKGN